MSLVLDKKRALVDKAVKTVMVGIAQRKPLSLSRIGEYPGQEGNRMKQPWLIAIAGVVIGLQSGVAFAVNPEWTRMRAGEIGMV